MAHEIHRVGRTVQQTTPSKRISRTTRVAAGQRGAGTDAAFFDRKLLGFLEERPLPYVIVVRPNAVIQWQARYLTGWTERDADTAVNEFTLQMSSWKQARHWARLRNRSRETGNQNECRS